MAKTDFKPSYTLSPNLITNIAAIERFYGQIEALHIPKKLELNLTRNNMVQSSYASNKIEGNPLTLPEVTNLLLDERVPATRDEKEVVNYFNILKRMEDYRNTPITLDMIIKFHKELMTGVDKTAGVIRNVPVVIGRYSNEKGDVSLQVKHNPPYHDRKHIEKNLNELISWTRVNDQQPIIVLTGIFHHQFVYIHPFEDGNGRVCRLLSALLFLQHGYHINRYFILDDYYDIDRQDYSDKLHTADRGDKTEWLEYYSDGVKYSLQSAIARFSHAMRTLSIRDQPTNKEQMVLTLVEREREVTSHTIAKVLKVSRQQAHALLRNLVDKGLLDKKGTTKASYYTLK